jgi:hypothetical protein
VTKAREVELLDETIATFGPDSYLGPWLAEYRESIRADIANDLSVSAPLPSVARAESVAILNRATEDAAAIVETARRKAQALEVDAYAKVAKIRKDAQYALGRLAGQL